MPLKDYLQKQGLNAPTPTTAVGSLSNFLNRPFNITSTTTSQSTPQTTNKGINPQVITKPVGDTFRWIGKQLMKPQGVLVKEMRAVGESLGNFLKGNTEQAKKSFIENQKGALNVITGKEQTSYSQQLAKVGAQKDIVDKIFGIGGDLLVDPLWIIKPVKIAEKIGEITKLGKPIKTLADIIKEAPATKKVVSLFSNATGNPEFDAVVQKFRNLRQYREGQLIDQAVQLQKDIKKFGKGSEEIITQGLENPTSLEKITDPKIIRTVNNLKSTYKEFLDKSREVGLSIGEIKDYAPHIRTKESFLTTLKNDFGLGVKEWGTANVQKGRTLQGTIEELSQQGIDIFEKNPAIQLAKKGMAYTKAITSKEFANEVAKFAVEKGTEVTNPLLKGLKFASEHAKVIDNFYQGIKPPELNVIIKSFDKVQNWWKAQALISPSYHIRNMFGNFWNNFLARVNPAYYFKAGLLQKGLLKDDKIIEEAKQLGVINQGWYAKDIADEIANRVAGIGKVTKGLNPLSQENYLFKANKAVGSIIENNARLAHYLSKVAEGLTPEKAAQSVKKYLFDYGDLTSFEKNVMKRLVPFYTWTRKNIPIQLEGLLNQPAKMVLPEKLIQRIESGVEQPNEKYMSQYIGENIPVRIRKNKDGNTEYFLLGNWLPYAQAIDVLSRPLDNLIGMTTPMIKTPYEYLSNQSTFFKNTLNQPAPIERDYKQQGEFLGVSLRNKNIQLLRNIRILNDINKWVDKQDPTAVKDTWIVKFLNTMFGKTQTYDVGKSKYFYDRDTQDRVDEYRKAITSAEKKGYTDKATQLRDEMNNFIKQRHE